ncbi:MAG: extracellular solute-binding protein, partial [Treponema sp.]|nr:extracellular solute-binding protein [Treponema sp.]
MISKKFKKFNFSKPGIRLSMIFAYLFLVITAVNPNGQTATQAIKSPNTDYLNANNAMPIVNKKITLQLVTEKGPISGPADQIWFWKWAEQTMNIHFDVIQLESPTALEKQNLMFASNELPDIFFSNPAFSPSDLLQYGQKEKQLIPLNTLIEKYAPTLNSFFQKSPTLKAQSTCPDGNIYFLPGFNYPPQSYQGARAWINMGWLNKLGMKMPETLDDLNNVLVAFRD